MVFNYIQNNISDEWLVEYLLPNLVNRIKKEGYYNILEYLNKTNTYKELVCGNLTSNNHTNYNSLSSQCNDNFIDVIEDLYNVVTLSSQIQFHVVNFIYIFKIFIQLLITSVITLFTIPFTVVVLMFASSAFIFFSKQLCKMKVMISIKKMFLNSNNF